MALFVEKENPPAGANFKVGDNAELDAAISAGEAPGITVGADGYYICDRKCRQSWPVCSCRGAGLWRACNNLSV